jgi:hypothetical protein
VIARVANVQPALSREIKNGDFQMKALMYSLIIATLVSEPAISADVPSLVGTWTGQRDRIAKVEGRRGGLATLVITEQQLAPAKGCPYLLKALGPIST